MQSDGEGRKKGHNDRKGAREVNKLFRHAIREEEALE